MVNYGDYLKELERIADKGKRECIVARENEIKQLNAELAKLVGEIQSRYVEAAKLRQESANLTTELDRWNEYKRLVQEKNNVSTEEGYQDLASRFRSMGSYKDSAKLASECEEQCRILKERQDEDLYKRLVQEKNNVPTEYDAERFYYQLAAQFRAMGSYKDSAKLANECDEQCSILKGRRDEEERIAGEKRLKKSRYFGLFLVLR